MNISEKLIKLRKSKGMSQEELAGKLDVSCQAISRWETGAALPDANIILALSLLNHWTLLTTVLILSRCMGYIGRMLNPNSAQVALISSKESFISILPILCFIDISYNEAMLT